MQLTKVKR